MRSARRTSRITGGPRLLLLLLLATALAGMFVAQGTQRAAAAGGTFEFAETAINVFAGQTVEVEITRDGGDGEQCVVLGQDGSTAEIDIDFVDFVPVDGKVWFEEGETSKLIEITTKTNLAADGDLTIEVRLTASGDCEDAEIGENNALTITITNAPGIFGFEPVEYDVFETDGQVELTIVRSQGFTGGAILNWSTSNGTAEVGVNYEGVLNAEVVFEDGQESETIIVDILDDGVQTPTLYFTVTLTIGEEDESGADVDDQADTATVHIHDMQSEGYFAFSAASYAAAEDAGTVTITVVRLDGSAGPATVDYATENGTAEAGENYVATSGTLEFDDGETSASFDIEVLEDGETTGNLTVLLSLSNPTRGTDLGEPADAVLTIVDLDTDMPVVTSLSPPQGLSAGGTGVIIRGVNLGDATAVHFGGVEANFIGVSDTEVVAESPPGAGQIFVTVTTPVGTSEPTLLSRFTYIGPPVVTSVAPNSGPAEGGTEVTISGAGFTGATQVYFGETEAASFTVESDTAITAVTPAGEGLVYVRVENEEGLSDEDDAARFRFIGDTYTYQLYFRWEFFMWVGIDGIAVDEALKGETGDADLDSIYDDVTSVWYYEQGQWLSFFPAGVGIPGVNTLGAFEYGKAYFIAISVPELEWTVVFGP